MSEDKRESQSHRESATVDRHIVDSRNRRTSIAYTQDSAEIMTSQISRMAVSGRHTSGPSRDTQDTQYAVDDVRDPKDINRDIRDVPRSESPETYPRGTQGRGERHYGGRESEERGSRPRHSGQRYWGDKGYGVRQSGRSHRGQSYSEEKSRRENDEGERNQDWATSPQNEIQSRTNRRQAERKSKSDEIGRQTLEDWRQRHTDADDRGRTSEDFDEPPKAIPRRSTTEIDGDPASRLTKNAPGTRHTSSAWPDRAQISSPPRQDAIEPQAQRRYGDSQKRTEVTSASTSFIPGKGVELEALALYVKLCIDSGATIERTTHQGREGFLIRAARAPTHDEVRDIVDDSRSWQEERERSTRQVRFKDSATARWRADKSRKR